MWRRNDRINERDVPESQHTIFIRGFPGEMGSDQIRDFFAKEDYGSCSFDFVKVSPDRSKLYVAVRFDSKSSARDVMERFGTEGGEMLGYHVELSWFRDIRRYLAHCAKQGVRPSRFRGGGGGGGGAGMAHRHVHHQRGGGAGGHHGLKRNAHERSRSSRSHSAEANNSRTCSPTSRPGSRDSRSSRSRSHSADSRRSRTKSIATGSSVGGRSSAERRKSSLDYSDIVTTINVQPKLQRKEQKQQREPSPSPTPPPMKKSKKSVKRKKKERSSKKQQPHKRQQPYTPPHSPSISPGQRSDSDVEVASDEEEEDKEETVTNNSNVIKQHHHQQHHHQSTGKKQNNTIAAAAPASFANRFHPAVGAPVPPAAAAASSELLSTKTAELRSQTIVLNLSPKMNAPSSAIKQVDEPTAVDCLLNDSLTAALSHNNNINGSAHMSATVLPPQMRNGPDNGVIKMQQYQQQNGATIGGGCGGAMLNGFKEIQRAILVDVRYKPHEAAAAASDEDSASLGQLRLSSLSRKSLTEEKREEKVAKLSPELRDRVNKKKRQLELSYRNDCETYGLVANKLIAKDRLLEDRLKLALLETMKELEAETMKQLDDFLDQISFMF